MKSNTNRFGFLLKLLRNPRTPKTGEPDRGHRWISFLFIFLTILLACGASQAQTPTVTPIVNGPRPDGSIRVGDRVGIFMAYNPGPGLPGDPLHFSDARVTFGGDVGNISTALALNQCEFFAFFALPFGFPPPTIITSYSTPGRKTVTATVLGCTRFGTPTDEVFATGSFSFDVCPANGCTPAMRFQISPLALNFPGNPLQAIDEPEGSSPFSTSLTLKLGQHLSLKYIAIDSQSEQPATVPSTITFQSQKRNDMGNISNIFSNPTRLFPDNVLLHFTDPSPDEFFAVHSGKAVLDIKPNGPSSGAPGVLLTVNVPSCALGQSCGISLGTSHNEFDDDIVRFADFRGIPPQLVKSQVGVESSFNRKSYRYEPLTVDFKSVGLNTAQLTDNALAPWRIATSSDCSNIVLPQGTRLVLSSADANARNNYTIALNQQNQNPLCRVTNISQVQSLRLIKPADTLLSMENIFYTNDPTINWANADIFQSFADYQVDNPPFTGQTVIAASYGLHQVLYTTAVQDEGFVDANNVGRPPSSLFDRFTSLDLGSNYLAQKARTYHLDAAPGFLNLQDFFFQYGPALRGYNAPKIDFSVADIKVQCLNADLPPPPTPPARDALRKYRYACKALRRIPIFDRLQ